MSIQMESVSSQGVIPSSTPADESGRLSSLAWSEIVAQIEAGEPAGVEQLYKVLQRGLRYYLARQLGPQDLDDRIHEILLIVVRAIQKGDLREPERIMGFVRTVSRRQVAGQIEHLVQSRDKETELDTNYPIADRKQNPEQQLIAQDKIQIMKRALAQLRPRDREILERFYLHEQRPEQICREMSLTDTQFRLHKSRAKAVVAELGRQQMKRGVSSIKSRLHLFTSAN